MIYIQSNTERTLPHHFDVACAMYGAMDSGQDFRLTSFGEVQSGKFDALIKQNLFVGSVEFMREVFKRIGKHDVRLPMNSDRPYETITLEQVKARVENGEKLFIKPVEIKLFTGFVIDSTAVYASIKNLPSDTKVMAYNPFENKILSEWRLYIHNGKIVDARNYSGNFKLRPDYSLAEQKIKTLSGFPCAYTMDIGVLTALYFGREQDVVVEFNDMWAIGNYGMENSLYLRLLKERYFEIVKK